MFLYKESGLVYGLIVCLSLFVNFSTNCPLSASSEDESENETRDLSQPLFKVKALEIIEVNMFKF